MSEIDKYKRKFCVVSIQGSAIVREIEISDNFPLKYHICFSTPPHRSSIWTIGNNLLPARINHDATINTISEDIYYVFSIWEEYTKNREKYIFPVWKESETNYVIPDCAVSITREIRSCIFSETNSFYTKLYTIFALFFVR